MERNVDNKAMKKVKGFFDDKQKPKHRIASLLSFIEVALESDQVKFFNENLDTIIVVLLDAFYHQIEKISAKDTKGAQPTPVPAASNQAASMTKDATDLLKFMLVLRKIFQHVPTRIQSTAHKRQINQIIHFLCQQTGRQRLRIEGIRLLLHWFGCLCAELSEAIHIFDSLVASFIVSLEGTGYPLPTPLAIAKDTCIGEDECVSAAANSSDAVVLHAVIQSSAVVGSPTVMTPSTPADVSELIAELLEVTTDLVRAACGNSFSQQPTVDDSQWNENLLVQVKEAEDAIGSGVALTSHGALGSAVFVWGLVRNRCLRFFIPRRANAHDESSHPDVSFPTCPPQVLLVLLRFMAENLVKDNTVSTTPPSAKIPSPTVTQRTTAAANDRSHYVAKVLESVILGNEDSREFVHEVLRQSLLVPWSYLEIGRLGMFVLQSWTFSSNEDRPLFLQRIAQTHGRNPSAAQLPSAERISIGEAQSADISVDVPADASRPGDRNEDSNGLLRANAYLRRYIRYIRMLFLDKKDYIEHVEYQVVLIKEAIQFLRLTAMEPQIPLTRPTWETLMNTLTSINLHTLSRANKFASVSSPPHAEEICGLLVETSLCVWVRSGFRTEEVWVRLRECMEQCLRWSQAVTQWSKVVHKLTSISAHYVYGVDIDTLPPALEQIDSKTALRLRAASINSSRTRFSLNSSRHSHSSHGEPSPLAHSIDANELTTEPARFEKLLSTSVPGRTSASHLGTATASHAEDDSFSSINKANMSASVPVRTVLETEEVLSVSVQRRDSSPLLKELKSSMHSMLSIPSLDAVSDRHSQASQAWVPSLDPTFTARLSEFPNLNAGRVWDSESALFMWKNIICSIGDISNATIPAIHSELMTTFAWISDTMLRIRSIQPYDGVQMPSLFEFAPILVKAADTSAEFTDGRAVAIGSLCRIMCRRKDQEFESDYYTHFYRIIFKGLSSDDPKVITAIIQNCSKLFGLCLPGSNVLIPAFLKCFKKLVTSSTKDCNFHEDIKQNIIIILSSINAILNIHCVSTSESKDAHISASSIDSSTKGLPQLPEKVAAHSSKNVSESAAYQRKNSITAILSSSTSPTILGIDLASCFEENGMMHFSDLKVQAKELMFDMLFKERELPKGEKSATAQMMLLWSISTLAFTEMTNEEPQKGIIEDCVAVLLESLSHSSLKVVEACVDGLTMFALNSDRLRHFGGAEVQGVVEKLVGAISEQLFYQNITRSKEMKEQIVSRLLYCLLDWVMIIPPDLFSSPKVNLMVFEVIESVLDVSEETPVAENQAATSAINSGPQNPLARFRSLKLGESSSQVTRGLKGLAAFTSHAAPQKEAETDDDTSELDYEENIMKDAAENVLNHILRNYDKFPSPLGPSVMSSLIPDPSINEDIGAGKPGEDRALYFTFNDTTLLTVYDIAESTPQDTKSRIIIRDITGKYVWDSFLFYDSLTKVRKRIDSLESPRTSQGNMPCKEEARYLDDEGPRELPTKLETFVPVSAEPVPVTKPQYSYSRDRLEIPLYNPRVDTESVDMLNELLKYISEKHPDCLMHPGVPLNEPQMFISPKSFQTDNGAKEQLESMARSVDRQIEQERQYNTAFSLSVTTPRPENSYSEVDEVQQRPLVFDDCSTLGQSEVDRTKLLSYRYETPLLPSSNVTPFAKSRMFLAHLGQLNFDSAKEDCFHLLSKSPALLRDIKGLDRKHGREVMKIALIYVGPGQEEEQALFWNASGSPDYDEFVSSLGWEIDTATHTGYLGGLERSANPGVKFANYWCNSTLEVIFHNVTKLPTDPLDPKQLKKKRHIGNDHVHIVWNEHLRDYRKNIMGGDFGNAIIVITPVPNGLYVVDIIKDTKVPQFGPLLNRALVNKSCLGSLVRCTAINAYRAALHTGLNHGKHHAFSQRKSDISMIASRHKVAKWTFEKFIQTVFFPPSTHDEQNVAPNVPTITRTNDVA